MPPCGGSFAVLRNLPTGKGTLCVCGHCLWSVGCCIFEWSFTRNHPSLGSLAAIPHRLHRSRDTPVGDSPKELPRRLVDVARVELASENQCQCLLPLRAYDH